MYKQLGYLKKQSTDTVNSYFMEDGTQKMFYFKGKSNQEQIVNVPPNISSIKRRFNFPVILVCLFFLASSVVTFRYLLDKYDFDSTSKNSNKDVLSPFIQESDGRSQNLKNTHSESLHLPNCDILENNRFDCWPERNGATQEKCEERGCCWKPSSKPDTAPYCFFPSDYDGYKVTNLSEFASGIEAYLQRHSKTFFSFDAVTVKLEIEYQTAERLRIKVSGKIVYGERLSIRRGVEIL